MASEQCMHAIAQASGQQTASRAAGGQPTRACGAGAAWCGWSTHMARLGPRYRLPGGCPTCGISTVECSRPRMYGGMPSRSRPSTSTVRSGKVKSCKEGRGPRRRVVKSQHHVRKAAHRPEAVHEAQPAKAHL